MIHARVCFLGPLQATSVGRRGGERESPRCRGNAADGGGCLEMEGRRQWLGSCQATPGPLSGHGRRNRARLGQAWLAPVAVKACRDGNKKEDQASGPWKPGGSRFTMSHAAETGWTDGETSAPRLDPGGWGERRRRARGGREGGYPERQQNRWLVRLTLKRSEEETPALC